MDVAIFSLVRTTCVCLYLVVVDFFKHGAYENSDFFVGASTLRVSLSLYFFVGACSVCLCLLFFP